MAPIWLSSLDKDKPEAVSVPDSNEDDVMEVDDVTGPSSQTEFIA